MKKLTFILFILFLNSCFSAPEIKHTFYTLKTQNMEQVLTETGEVGSESEVNLDAPFSSKLNEIKDEGTQLKKGVEVGTLETVKEADQRDSAELEVQEAQFDIQTHTVEQRQKALSLGKQLQNAKLDVQIEKVKLKKLKKERDKLALIQVAQEQETLEQEIKIYTLESRERKRLFEQGYLSREESKAASLKLTEAQKRSTYLKAKAQVLKKGPLKETLQKQKVNLKKAQNQLKQVQKEVSIQVKIGKMNIKASEIRMKKAKTNFDYYRGLVKQGRMVSPAQGTLIYGKMRVGQDKVRIKAGDSVREGVTVARIVDLNKPLVRLFIHEIDIGQVRPGLKARVTLDAYPNHIYPGMVSKVVPVAQKRFESDQNNVRGFHAEVRVLNGDAKLKPGMTANIEIIEKTHPQTLVVPSQALVLGPEGSFCWLKTSEGLEKRAVVSGSSNAVYTQIRSGLKVGDQVVLKAEQVRK